MGKEIGAGAFGRVLKAVAVGGDIFSIFLISLHWQPSIRYKRPRRSDRGSSEDVEPIHQQGCSENSDV